MYLISTLNREIDGYEIIAIGTKKELEIELDKLRKSVWHNEDGTRKMFSDIYADTIAKNAKIVTIAVAKKEYKIDDIDYQIFVEKL